MDNTQLDILPSHPRIGDILLAHGKVQHEQIDRALRLQADSTERLGELLLQLGFISEKDLAAALAELFRLPLAQPEQYANSPDTQTQISLAFLQRHQVIPLAIHDGHVLVAMANPNDSYTLDALRLTFGKPLKVFVGTAADIQAALKTHLGEDDLIEETSNTGEEANIDDIEHLKDMASEAPVIRLVNRMIVQAIELQASDIHIEPTENSLDVRYRIDGVLRHAESPTTGSVAAIISRIKVMARLNIAERRLPQDGRIKIRVEGHQLDMRISTLPTLHGESVVMRLLNQSSVPLDFTALGFGGKNLQRLQNILNRPQGIILVTGPTGSGKTTTLYAALQQLNSSEKKILTVEDPIEYQLPGINQIQVKPQIDLTFANALRSILRQDPDIIMVGEMRDTETARIAVQAALTGHKVFSTLHTNDAASSITRLLDMHIDDFLLSSTVDGVIAQRLLRKLCTHCRSPYPIPDTLKAELAFADGIVKPQLYHAIGCKHCEQSGYSGRTTIAELLLMSEGIRKLIKQQADAEHIHQQAIQEGMLSMRQEGLLKAVQGITSIEEVERVTQTAHEAI